MRKAKRARPVITYRISAFVKKEEPGASWHKREVFFPMRKGGPLPHPGMLASRLLEPGEDGGYAAAMHLEQTKQPSYKEPVNAQG